MANSERFYREVVIVNILDRVKLKINRGLATVGVKSREAIDTTKMKSQISALRKQKKDGIKDLGSIVYELYTNGTSDEELVELKCESITAIDDEIRMKEEELRQLKAKSEDVLLKQASAGVCSCGNKIPPGMNFCTACGQKVTTEPYFTDTDFTCSQCNGKFPPGSTFCPHCGHRVLPRETVVNICSGCGTELPDTMKFCTKCGARM